MKRHTFIAGLGGLTKSMIAAAACVVTAAYAQSTATRLGCDLQLIEPSDKATSPKALQLTISLGKVGVDFGSGNIAVKVESNNNIQLNCLHRPHGYRPQSNRNCLRVLGRSRPYGGASLAALRHLGTCHSQSHAPFGRGSHQR